MPGLVFWNVCLLIAIVFSSSQSQKCHSVSNEDAIVAAHASEGIYKSKLTVGRKVPGTSFVVQKIVTPLLYSIPLMAFVATFENTTLICFKGTKSPVQFLQEIRAAFRPAKRLRYMDEWVHVLPYFWNAMVRFNPAELIPNPDNKRKYILTGHSLGGAIASLFALDMKEKQGAVWENADSCLITFGEPRVGDREYARLHDKFISPNRKLRFVYRKDIVPHIPPKPFFYHHSREIWIWKKMRRLWSWEWDTYWTACPLGDKSSYCSNNIPIKTIFSHSMTKYLRAIVSQAKIYYDRFKKKHKSFSEALCA